MLRRAGLSDTELSSAAVVKAAARSVTQTWLGVAHYLIQFAPALLAAGLLHRRTRMGAAGFALAPPLADWIERGRPIGPTRFVAGYWADEIAYGIGVVAQSVRERTVVPLRPIIVRGST
jgi:hypothetical protein